MSKIEGKVQGQTCMKCGEKIPYDPYQITVAGKILDVCYECSDEDFSSIFDPDGMGRQSGGGDDAGHYDGEWDDMEGGE